MPCGSSRAGMPEMLQTRLSFSRNLEVPLTSNHTCLRKTLGIPSLRMRFRTWRARVLPTEGVADGTELLAAALVIAGSEAELLASSPADGHGSTKVDSVGEEEDA